MFCPKCGCDNNSESKFCQKCGAQISPVTASLQQKFEAEFNSQDAAVTSTSAVKKTNKGLIVALIICAILAAGVVGTTVVLALNSQSGNKAGNGILEGFSSVLSPSSTKGNNETDYSSVISDNEQLKAWWDLELKLKYGQSGGSQYYSSYDLNWIEPLQNLYPNVNATCASPTKYTKIDMNDDGLDELVVMGKNPFQSEPIIGIYYYDKESGEPKLLKIHDSNFAANNDSYQDVICADKTIKSTYAGNLGEIVTLYKMEGNSLTKVNEFDGTKSYPSNESELAEAQKQYNEFSSIANSYVEDTSIAWNNFNAVTPSFTLTGTIKVQTPYDRVRDPNTRAVYIEGDRKAINDIGFEYGKDETNIVFESDDANTVPCTSTSGTLTAKNVIAYLLESLSKNKGASSDFEKLKVYDDQHVKVTLNGTKLNAIGGLTGTGIDISAGGSVIDIQKLD